MTRAENPRPRQWCAGCNRYVPVTKDGSYQVHFFPAGASEQSECVNSGKNAVTTDKPFDPQAFKESLDAAAGPLRRVAAVTAQIGLSRIPADAACCCHCPVYEPHECEGWRAEGLVREVPSTKMFGKQPPPVQVPVCRSCHGAQIREARG